MAGEKIIEQSELVAAGLKSDVCTKLVEQNMASRKDGIPSETISSLPHSGDATSTLKVKGDTHQESVVEQGVYYPPTSCYDYCYPGYNGAFSQMDDRGYFNAGGGSYTGIQSDNGSLLYYLPSYDPYATGTFMGVDRQQPYFSSSGYLQHPVSYGSEAMPSYSWDSTYVGDVSNGTTTIRGSMKSALGSNVSVKSNGFNSVKSNNTRDSKTTNLPLDMKSRQSMASSNFSKSILHTQPLKPLNKLGSGFQTAGLVKGIQPVGKFSPFYNRNQGDLFAHNSPLNYRSIAQAWNGNDRFKSREKPNRGGDFEASTELTRGPRAQNESNPLNTAPEDEQPGLSIRRDQFNLEDFQTKYDNAKFYVIKSYSEDDIHKCIKYDVWSSTPNGNKKLDAAFLDAEAKTSETGTKCSIFFFFSVNGSGQFVGVAEMIGRVDFDQNMDFWQLDKWNGFFPVKWHIIKDIPNTQLRHIILENNDNRPVTYTRDTQEIGLKQGLDMLKIFKSYTGKTSLLDDFNFYEIREMSLKAKRNSDPKQLKAGESIIEGNSVTTDDTSDATSSLINLTRNLSLNSRPLKGSAVMKLPSITASEAL